MATKTIAPKTKGQKPIKFQEGGEHASTHTPPGQPIPAAKKAAAKAGKFGPKAKAQELFRENVLHGAAKGAVVSDSKNNIAKGLKSAGYPTMDAEDRADMRKGKKVTPAEEKAEAKPKPKGK